MKQECLEMHFELYTQKLTLNVLCIVLRSVVVFIYLNNTFSQLPRYGCIKLSLMQFFLISKIMKRIVIDNPFLHSFDF